MAYQSKPVSEQVMVITGASSGIGLATAIAAAGQGAKVVLASRSGPVLESAVEYITGAGGKARSVTADVSQRADVERIAATAIETLAASIHGSTTPRLACSPVSTRPWMRTAGVSSTSISGELSTVRWWRCPIWPKRAEY